MSSKSTPTGGTETTTEKKIVFESDGVTYRTNPKTFQFEPDSKKTDTESVQPKTSENPNEKAPDAQRTVKISPADPKREPMSAYAAKAYFSGYRGDITNLDPKTFDVPFAKANDKAMDYAKSKGYVLGNIST